MGNQKLKQVQKKLFYTLEKDEIFWNASHNLVLWLGDRTRSPRQSNLGALEEPRANQCSVGWQLAVLVAKGGVHLTPRRSLRKFSKIEVL